MNARYASSRDRDLFTIAFAIAVIVIVAVNSMIGPSEFLDYDTYLFYIDSIWYFPSATPFYMEPLSRVYLYAVRSVSETTNGALDLLHYILGAGYMIGLYTLLRKRPDGWQALLVAFAITAPLLAFVTVRATPAYLLVALAVITAAEHRWRSIGFMGLALCFHVSTALAVLPWLLLLIRENLPLAFRAERVAPLILLGAVVAILFIYFGQSFVSATMSVLEGVPGLSKYLAYSQDYGSQRGQISVTSINHYIFFAFSIGYAMIYLVVAGDEAKKINLYVVASLAVYVTLFFGISPVAAFRQACFWQLPMTVLLPWRRLGLTASTAPFLLIGALAFFLFQLGEVHQ